MHEMRIHFPMALVEMTENLTCCLLEVVFGIQCDDEHRKCQIGFDAELELLVSSTNVEKVDDVSSGMGMADGLSEKIVVWNIIMKTTLSNLGQFLIFK